MIAESFERIHRSNLVGMGVLPLQFPDGESASSLGLSGEEVFSISGLAEAMADGGGRRAEVQVHAERAGAGAIEFAARVRIDTPREAEYFRHGGILQYVLRALLARAARRCQEIDPARRPAASAQAERSTATAPARLLAARGPSGYETAPAAAWREAASAFAEVSTDAMGTPWRASRRSTARAGRGGWLVMGHIDEIGLIVTHIDDEGYLWFREVGGWDAQILVGQRVVLDTRDGPLAGVVGKKPIHLLRDEERKKVAEIRDLHIDIGARDGEQARARGARSATWR